MSELGQGIFQMQLYVVGITPRKTDRGQDYWTVSALDVNKQACTITCFQYSAIQHLQMNTWGMVFIKAKPDNKGGQFLNAIPDPSIPQTQLPAGSAPPPATANVPPPPQVNTGAIPPANMPGATSVPPAPLVTTTPVQDQAKRTADQIMRADAGIMLSNIISGGEKAFEFFNIFQPFDFDQLWERFYNVIKTGNFQDDPLENINPPAGE